MAVSLLQLLGNAGQPASALAPASPSLQVGAVENAVALLGEEVNTTSFSFSEMMAQYKSMILSAIPSDATQRSAYNQQQIALSETPLEGEVVVNKNAVAVGQEDYFQALFVSFTQTIITTSPEIAKNLTFGAIPALSLQAQQQVQEAKQALAEIDSLWQEYFGEVLPLPEEGGIIVQQTTIVALVFAPITAQLNTQMGESVDEALVLPALEGIQPDDVNAAYSEVPIIAQPDIRIYSAAIGLDANIALQAEITPQLKQNDPAPSSYVAPPPARLSSLFYGQDSSVFIVENAPLSLPLVAGTPLSKGGESKLDTLSSLISASSSDQQGAAMASFSSLHAMIQKNDGQSFALPSTAPIMQAIGDGDMEILLPDGAVESASPSSSSAMEELSTPPASKDISLTRFITQEQASARFTPYEQMAVHIKQLHNNKKGQMTVQLHPAELGRVDIRVGTQEDGSLLVRVMTELRDTYDLLRNDKLTLERILQDSGLQMQHGSLEFSHQERKDSAFEAFSEPSLAEDASQPSSITEEQSAAVGSEEHNSLTWVATTGLNIRV